MQKRDIPNAEKKNCICSVSPLDPDSSMHVVLASIIMCLFDVQIM